MTTEPTAPMGAYGEIVESGQWKGVTHYGACWMCFTCGFCKQNYHGHFCPCVAGRSTTTSASADSPASGSPS